MSFQLSVNKRCLSAPDATSLHHCLKNHLLLSLIEFGHWILSQLWVRGFLKYMPSPLYSASVVVFQLHGGWVSHMQALATPSTVHNTWILTTESISVLAACS